MTPRPTAPGSSTRRAGASTSPRSTPSSSCAISPSVTGPDPGGGHVSESQQARVQAQFGPSAAHHFPALLPALRQVARVLRAGGSFLVEDIQGHDDEDAAAFILEVERRRDPSHVRAFRHLEWTAFLRAAGLTVIDES